MVHFTHWNFETVKLGLSGLHHVLSVVMCASETEDYLSTILSTIGTSAYGIPVVLVYQ